RATEARDQSRLQGHDQGPEARRVQDATVVRRRRAAEDAGDSGAGSMKIDAQPLWDWMNERHRIWVRRNAGHKWPWTEDPILREYKFTNVFREYDAVTLELHKRVDEMATSRRSRAEPWDRMFHIILFRAF